MNAILVMVGAVIAAVAIELFLVPNKVIDGGIVGISIIVSHLTKLPLGFFLFGLNIPFFLFGYKQIGKSFAVNTLLGVTIFSLSTTYLHHLDPVTDDVLLATVFGGIILGIGIGLVLRYGGSLDGTEILGVYFSKNLPFSVGQIVMFFNIFILGSAGFVFGWESTMYSLMTYFIAIKMIDTTVEGLQETRSVWIISKHTSAIADAIINKMGRGVTYLNGEGAYTRDSKQVIFCIVTRLEETNLKRLVEEIDPNAFVAVGHIYDVHGGDFNKQNAH